MTDTEPQPDQPADDEAGSTANTNADVALGRENGDDETTSDDD